MIVASPLPQGDTCEHQNPSEPWRSLSSRGSYHEKGNPAGLVNSSPSAPLSLLFLWPSAPSLLWQHQVSASPRDPASDPKECPFLPHLTTSTERDSLPHCCVCMCVYTLLLLPESTTILAHTVPTFMCPSTWSKIPQQVPWT